jgi:hypothetical protein
MGCGCKNAEGGCGCGTKEMNWESYDKPSFTKTMMAENDTIPMIISIDTSGSTSMKFKAKVFEFDTINAQYRKIAISAIYSLNPSEVTIFDHNMTVEQVFKGNEYDAVQFIRDKDNLQPRNGTARMSAIIDKISGMEGNKLILTDGQFQSKAEKSYWNAEEPVVQEPDWIPAGDGRAIGQQDFAINLSPLHAENEDEAEMECSWCGKDVKKGDKFYFVDGAWSTDALCVSCKEAGDDEDADWGKLNIEDGTWDAEGDSATYSPSDEPDMVTEIQTSPTNESPQLFNASNTFNTTTALGIGGLVVAALSLPMLYSSAKSRLGKSAEEKRKSNGSVRKNHTQVKNSEYSVGQVNPVEAEGQQDIHGAEGITNPRHSPSPTPSGYPSKNLKMW